MCVHVCVHMCSGTQVHKCAHISVAICVCVETRGQCQVSSSVLFFEMESLTEAGALRFC